MYRTGIIHTHTHVYAVFSMCITHFYTRDSRCGLPKLCGDRVTRPRWFRFQVGCSGGKLSWIDRYIVRGGVRTKGAVITRHYTV